jgi:hypothetical protein
MKKLYLFALFLLPAFAANAQTPTWANDIASIFYAKCTNCHNPTGIAPFSLLDYNDAANNAIDIANETQARTMPPWPPDSSYTRFSHERLLTAGQIQKIADWVNAGMPSGNLSQAPPQPVYTGIATITNPDLVSQMQNYTVTTATDLYRCFVIPTNISTTEYITKVEVLPGNRNIVHHVLVYQDQANTCVNLDNADPGPGYTWFGGVGSNSATLIAGWVPGQGAWELPVNMGIKLLPNSYIIMQIHYPGGTVSQLDSTQVRFTFSGNTVREVSLSPVINHSGSLTNGPLFIPADSVKTFHGQETASLNASLISIAPHMHLIGRNIINYAIDPSNDTIPLIRINDWNFHWQGFYTYRQPVHIPYGSTIHAYATYDNTLNNPWNPNNPTEDVYAGEATTDEMMIVYYAYLSYQPGDENIIIDSTVLAGQSESWNELVKTPQLYNPYPVPASANSTINVSYFLPNQSALKIELFDINGKLISVPANLSNASAGFGTTEISSSGLAAGSYTIRLSAGGTVRTKTIVIQ